MKRIELLPDEALSFAKFIKKHPNKRVILSYDTLPEMADVVTVSTSDGKFEEDITTDDVSNF